MTYKVTEVVRSRREMLIRTLDVQSVFGISIFKFHKNGLVWIQKVTNWWKINTMVGNIRFYFHFPSGSLNQWFNKDEWIFSGYHYIPLFLYSFIVPSWVSLAQNFSLSLWIPISIRISAINSIIGICIDYCGFPFLQIIVVFQLLFVTKAHMHIG